MFGKWCVESSIIEFRNGYRYVLVSCTHQTKIWKSLDNMSAGKSTGCIRCGLPLIYSKEDKLLSKRFQAMMSRCHNQHDPNYSGYGGRGIFVEEWLQIIANYLFYIKSLPNYSTKLELDRIDNNKGYQRDNLRWVDGKTNKRNTRRNIRVVFEGKEMVWSDFVRNYTYLSNVQAKKYYDQGYTLEAISQIIPKHMGRRVQGLRSGKLRADESVYGRKFNST